MVGKRSTIKSCLPYKDLVYKLIVQGFAAYRPGLILP